jgi:hypothetical protein
MAPTLARSQTPLQIARLQPLDEHRHAHAPCHPRCTTESGTIERHTYDEANRLTDEGVEYETFGNTPKPPTIDADEHELKNTYYVDGQVATQEQNGETINYSYDPAGRYRQEAARSCEASSDRRRACPVRDGREDDNHVGIDQLKEQGYGYTLFAMNRPMVTTVQLQK